METIIHEKDNLISVLSEENEKLGSEITIQNQNKTSCGYMAHETQVVKNEYEMKLSAALNLVEELENVIEIGNNNSKNLIEENLSLKLQLKFMDKEFNDQGDFLNDKM